MKRIACILLMAALTLPFVLSGPLTADCENVTGQWKFDMGGGYLAQVEYKADGTFVQTMSGMNISGKYTVKNKVLTTDVSGKQTVFSIISCGGDKLTVKRQKDGKTVVYTK